VFRDEFQSKIFTLADLPSEILQNRMACWLDAQDLSHFSQTSHSYYTLFKYPPLKVAYLLKQVVKSDYDSVETILEQDASLLLRKGQARDCCRTFQDITAFQYALWALDWQMWTIMLFYFYKKKQMSQALQQLEELESRGTPYGIYYDFMPLIISLDNYVKYSDCWWSCDTCTEYWNKSVYTIRKDVPAHVANNCRRERIPDYLHAVTDLYETSHNMLAKLKQELMLQCVFQLRTPS